MSPEMKALMKQFREYCERLPHGGKKDVADALGILPSQLSNLLKEHKREPTGSQTLAIQRLLGRTD